MKFSTFQSKYATTPKTHEADWAAFTRAMHRTYQSDAKDRVPLFSPATFSGARCVENAIELSMLVLDVDNSLTVHTGRLNDRGRPETVKICQPYPVTARQVLGELRRHGVASMLATTYSHKPGWIKFRVVIPLARAIPGSVWPDFAEQAIDALGLRRLAYGMDLSASKDPARMYYWPSAPTGEECHVVELHGTPLDLPTPAARPTVRLVSSSGSDSWLKAYADLKTLDLANLLRRNGFQVKAPSNGKRRCQCPVCGSKHDDAFIRQDAGKYPVFKCSHDSCQASLKEVLSVFGPTVVNGYCASFTSPRRETRA